MSMGFERPDPTTNPPEIRAIPLEPPDRKVKCEYCGRITKADNELCPSCGAPLNDVVNK